MGERPSADDFKNLSMILGRSPDLIVIAALLIMNAVLGFAQEQQAEKAVEALKRKLSVRARVLRDGGAL